MLVQEFLENSVDQNPEKTALICGTKRWRYIDIENQANRIANALVEAGFQRGDRALLNLPNGPELVIAIFSILKAGGVFVVVNPSMKSAKLTYILQNCQARVIFTSSPQFLKSEEALPDLRLVISVGNDNLDQNAANWQENNFYDLSAEYSNDRPICKNIDLDLACLIYTSGSTGEPKGVMSDHSNIDFVSSSIIKYLENTPDDIIINFLPLSFDYGLYQLLMTFKFGGTLVLERGFQFPAQILNRISQEKVTGLPGVPTIFAMLLQMNISHWDLSHLRYLTNTAAALPPSHLLRLHQLIPQAKIYSMYGLTETKRTLYLPPDQVEIRPSSVGIPIPGTEVWLEDETGKRLGANQVGELVIRGRHVMRGYWNDPETSSRIFRPGHLPGERICYSGDYFRRDEEGYYYFVARKNDFIKSRGEKVSPVEVERALYLMEGVVEAAVVGVPDPVLGQAIKAYIVTNGSPITKNQVLLHCRSHLEDYMVPKFIEFCPDLPKTNSGKVDRLSLAQMNA